MRLCAGRSRYRSAGTVEFVLDGDTGEFYFLEVNTRIQVEHGVTEEVTGVDLIEWMVRLAAGELPRSRHGLAPTPKGASIQARVYAEDPARGFRPGAGLLTEVDFPEGRRASRPGSRPGTEVTPFYDPMLAKIIARGDDRDEAVAALAAALEATRLAGIETNLRYLRRCSRPGLRERARCITRLCSEFTLRGADNRGSRARHADHHAGLPGPARLLGRRGSALGSHGRALVPARQSAGGQPRRRGRARDARSRARRCASTETP